MGRPEVTGRKIRLIRGTGEDDRDAFSVREFCSRHGISVQVFYKRRSEMPNTFRVGSRVLISKEAAARWRAAGERAVGRS